MTLEVSITAGYHPFQLLTLSTIFLYLFLSSWIQAWSCLWQDFSTAGHE